MAVTVSLYNHTTKLLANKEVDFTAIKLALLDNSVSFDATDVTFAEVKGGVSPDPEVYGNGWAQLGVLLANVAVTVVTTNDAKLDADDVSVTASGGSIGPAYNAVAYDTTTQKPLFFIAFGGLQEAGIGTDFKVIWNASGIITFTYT